MIADHFRETIPYRYPWIEPYTITTTSLGPTQAEFDALKETVEDMKKLLAKAKEYDKKNNEPDCEMEDKVAALKKIAQLVGVDLDSL